MIKIDPYHLRTIKKNIVFPGIVVFALISIYSLLFILLSSIAKKKGIKNHVIATVHIVIIIAAFIYLKSIPDYHIIRNFIKPYFDYIRYLPFIDPIRIIISASYSLYCVYNGHLAFEGMDEWVIEEEQKKRKKRLPQGEFDYSDRSHLLVFGASRTGKGVGLNHIIQHRLLSNSNEILIMVSAKLASGDKYSQLAYMRKMAEETGRTLYVVSMDESVEDRYQYNPFRYLTKDEMRNAIATMIEIKEPFYRYNFRQWVMSIFKALKIGENTISINNILALYDWSDYVKYIQDLVKNGKISQQKAEEMQNKKIEKYAKIAQDSSAQLDEIIDGCSSVLDPTPNRKKITITKAMKMGALMYFDLNGTSSEESVKLIGAGIMQEMQHCVVAFPDPDQKKTVIYDEASYYVNEHLVKTFFNESASMGYQCILSTQGPSDLMVGDKLRQQMFNNAGQMIVSRIGEQEDVEYINGYIGTYVTTENTHRAQSIDYDGTGSIKPVNQVIVPFDVVKNLQPLEAIYVQKSKSQEGSAKPVKINWSTEDL